MKRKRAWLAGGLAVVVLSACTAGWDGQQDGYPVESQETMTYWTRVEVDSALAPSINETPFAKGLVEQTGVHVDFIQPPRGKANEYFAMITASRNLPDMIEYDWTQYPGGKAKAMADGMIIDLKPMMGGPLKDYRQRLEETEGAMQAVRQADGSIPTVTYLTGNDPQTSFYGMVVRRDWLRDLGLEMPETIEELGEVLRQFKERKGASKPLSFHANALDFYCLIGSYGVTRDFFMQDGKVRFGPLEPGYEAFTQCMNAWYREGLLDAQIASIDVPTIETGLVTGQTGVTCIYAGAQLPKLTQRLRQYEQQAELAAMRQPTLVKGERPKISYQAKQADHRYETAVSTVCKTPELAAKFLNYGYTEQGSDYYTYGTKDKSYTMQDGRPAYTEEITKNPSYGMTQMLAYYTRAGSGGPFLADGGYLEQYMTMPQQQEALRVWGDSDAQEYLLPAQGPNETQAQELGEILPALRAYEHDMLPKFIIGAADITMEEYRHKLRELGAERAVQIYQQMLDQYHK